MCNKKKYSLIHVHSTSSLLDGCASPKKIVAKAKEKNCYSVALNNHANPCDLFEFYKECKKSDIRPVLGLEFYICNDLKSRIVNKERELEERDYHQSLYIKDKEGYLNFNYLTYMSFTEGYYYKARIDFELMFERKKGLMATSSCMAGKIGNYICNNRYKEATDLFKKYVVEFGEDFYAELQFNEIPNQKLINDFILHQAKKYDVPLIIGADTHYIDKQDCKLQDALIASKRENTGTDWTIEARKLYFHDIPDYVQFNKELGWNYDEKLLEECFENSIKFSEKANFEFETGKYHLPKINTEGIDSNSYLQKLSYEGAEKRINTRRKFGEVISDEFIDIYEKRIDYELKIIKDLGIADYLLIVYDIINWEKLNGFYVGPGRGSCAGSLIAYLIGISDCCPVTHDLLFERFINPERKQLPDIDWDSSAGAREAILLHLVEKYGQESVCNVATFGTFGAKSALQAMSRGLHKDTGQDSILMRKITKLPEIEDTKNDIKDLVEYFKKVRTKSLDIDVNNWIDNNQDTIVFAQKIQGQMQQLGMHAGGIVITPGPIYDFIPVTRGSGNLVTAFREADGSSKDLSELGILKLDVLGLNTLNIFKYCVDHIKKDKGIDLYDQLYYLPLNDSKIFEYFMNGSSYGVFQMERAKMFTSKINVDSFEDIVSINALNRPGPLEKYLNKYGYWKNIDKKNIKISKEELEKIDKERYPFPFMRSVLSKTYGCLIYQEQFMLLVKEAAGFDMGEADNFRRGIAWLPDNPKYHTVEKYFQKLEKGMMDKGYKKEDVDFFVKYCRDFLGYSFNRSHSVCYAYIAYLTLYFKVYYPAYFYAAMINSEGDTDKIQLILSDAKDYPIQILPHSIIKSSYETKVESDSSIRLGYGMIKGMGTAVQEELIELKLDECKTLGEVLQKKFKKINSTQFESLIDIGAFDEFNIDREVVRLLHGLYSDPKIEQWFTRKKQTLRLEVIPAILKENFDEKECLKIAMRVKSEQEPWKLLLSELINKVKLEELNKKKYDKITSQKQKELLGFNLNSDSKLMDLASSFRAIGILPVSEFENENKEYYFLVEKITVALTKTNKKYLQLILNDGKQTIKTKCWRELDVKEDEIYCGKFKKDNFGFTLQDKGVRKI